METSAFIFHSRFLHCFSWWTMPALQWRHNERNGVSNHRRLDGSLNRLFRRRSKKTSKLRVTGLYEGNSLVTGEFPTQRASNAENMSIWWRQHVRWTQDSTSSALPLDQPVLCNQVGGDTWSTYVRPSGSHLPFYIRRTLIGYTEKI